MATILESAPKSLTVKGLSAGAELQALCLCARVHLPGVARQQLESLLGQDLDWQLLYQLAWRHRLVPLLHRQLKACGAKTVPIEWMQKLHQESQQIAFRNLALAFGLIELIRCFQREGIESIPLKGPVLAELAYGDLALRHFDDLDIIVRPGDLARARELILTEGYKPYPYEELGSLFAENSCHNIFNHPRLDYNVELHWALAPSYFPLEFKRLRLWQHLRHIPFGGLTVWGQSPEDLVLALCIHGGKHHWLRLSWIVDVAELLRRHHDMNWELLVSEAARLRCKRLLLLGIWLAENVLQAPVPSNISDLFSRDPVVPLLGAEVWDGIAQRQEISWAGIKNVTFVCRVRECTRDRVVYLFLRMFTPTQLETAWLWLPRPLYFLYSPLRALRLTIQRGGTLLKRLLLGAKK